MKLLKKILACVWCVVICLPCLLVFTEGKNGEFTILNIIGVIYMFFLAKGVFGLLVPKWMWRYMERLCRL